MRSACALRWMILEPRVLSNAISFEDASVLLVKDFSQGTVEKGQIRDYLMAYIGSQCQGIITNAIDGKKNFFQLTGYDWDKELRAEAVRQINAGLVEIPTSENGLSFIAEPFVKRICNHFKQRCS